MFTYLLVGGRFGDTVTDSRPSGYVQKLFEAMSAINPLGWLLNGGNYSDLEAHLEEACSGDYQVVLWMPDVSNDQEKLIGHIKERNPRVLLVSSKNNKSGKYGFMELVARALRDKANLFVEFTRKGGQVRASVNDPLGCRYCDSTDIDRVALALVLRLNDLCKFTRMGSCSDGAEIFLPEETEDIKEFLSLIRGYADTFHEYIHPAESSRFLGNASFRCESGFPSFKDDAGRVFVSKRNVNKLDMGLESFVPVKLFTLPVLYGGTRKPSVDTPVQLMLYRYYPNIHFMLHSHVYVEDDRVNQTCRPVPCGAIEEFYEIIKIYPERDKKFAIINLVGHGSLVMSKDVASLRHINYIPRKFPEIMGSPP